MNNTEDQKYLANMCWRRNAETAFWLAVAALAGLGGWLAGSALLGWVVAAMPLAKAAWNWHELRLTGGIEAVRMRSRRRAERQARDIAAASRMLWWINRIVLIPLALLAVFGAVSAREPLGVSIALLALAGVILAISRRFASFGRGIHTSGSPPFGQEERSAEKPLTDNHRPNSDNR